LIHILLIVIYRIWDNFLFWFFSNFTLHYYFFHIRFHLCSFSCCCFFFSLQSFFFKLVFLLDFVLQLLICLNSSFLGSHKLQILKINPALGGSFGIYLFCLIFSEANVFFLVLFFGIYLIGDWILFFLTFCVLCFTIYFFIQFIYYHYLWFKLNYYITPSY
jgi:hypothetical protein